ncbi:hypothetical protein ACNKHN_21960 [Shigella flexneri]
MTRQRCVSSIIANMLQEHDNPFTLYPYDTKLHHLHPNQQYE